MIGDASATNSAQGLGCGVVLLKHLEDVVARFWEHGFKIDWQVFHSHHQRDRVSMPTYPFERKQHWIIARKFSYETNTAPPLTQTVLEPEQNDDHLLQTPVSAQGDAIEQQVSPPQ